MKEGSGFSRRVLAALAAAFMLGSIFTLGGQKLWSLWQGAPSVSPEMAAKIAELEELIDAHYLFDVDAEDAANAAAAGLSDALDQYSIYRTPEEYEAFQDHNNGDMCGIGITVSQYEEDALTVLYLSDGSPAEGILEAGDEIVAVEGQQVAEAGYQQAVSLVRGTAGTDVRLTVRRGDEIFDATVTRADIVDTGIHGEIYGNIGYVKVSAFNNATPEAFYNTIYDQIDAGVEGLVFDLRGNGGGLLTSVTGMLDFLLPEGDLVSRTDKEGKTTVMYTSGASCIDLPMAVLVNGSTASAAELFACDLQEYGVAVVVGTQTYGKGVMQTTYELSDGSSLTLTTDYYNPMSGQNYNGEGVTPDIVVEMTEEEQENYRLLDPERDPQLKAALEALGWSA